jgi:hypothetical protein
VAERKLPSPDGRGNKGLFVQPIKSYSPFQYFKNMPVKKTYYLQHRDNSSRYWGKIKIHVFLNAAFDCL